MSTAAPRWLAIVGIGEDGVEALAPAARRLVADAGLVYGGSRHLKLAEPLIRGEARVWPRPVSDAVPEILARRGSPVAVLASGDPFWFGIGAMLASVVEAEETICLPAPSSVSLAAARLGWSQQDAAVVSLCGRPLETLAPHLQPGRRLFVLSADAATPGAVAAYLTERGFAESRLHLLEALGGPDERIRRATAGSFAFDDVAALNLLALELEATADARVIPLSGGLPDAMFETDGQLTKREIRAVTLSSLASRAGETLWDIGCGSGSVAVEWLLRHPANRAVAFEARQDRAARAARNACALGVPHLEVVTGRAPGILDRAERPHAVFVGGGAGEDGVIDAAWNALRPGGRIVVNAVTLAGEATAAAQYGRHGGTLARLSVERLEPIGNTHGFRPAMTVTQWTATK